jgi:predicted RND superfamily exporter protein
MVMFNPVGRADSKVLSNIVNEISEKNLPEEKIHYAGPVILTQHIQDSMGRDLYTLLPICALLVILTLYYCFKSIRGMLLPSIGVVVSTIWIMGLIALVTGELSMISVIIPILLVAIGSAYGIHSLSRYYEVITTNEDKKEGIKSLVRGISLPILMTGITTMIGFLCLLTSNLEPIKIFGMFSAFGIFSALFNAIFLIPSILLVQKVKGSRNDKDKTKKEIFLIRGLDRLSVFVLKREVLIVVIAGVILIGGVVGLSLIKTETNMKDMFPKNSEPAKAMQLIRDDFVGSIFLQMVVKGDIKNPIVLEQMLEIETFLDSRPELSKSSSIADYIAEMNDVMNGTRKIPDTREGVANLLFFLEGNDILKRMVTHDYDEAIIQVKLAELATEEIKRIEDDIYSYVASNAMRDFIEISLYKKIQ